MKELKNAIINYLFSSKSLNSILFILVSFLISEIAAYGNGQAVLDLVETIKGENPKGSWIHYGAILVDIIWGKGSLFVIFITALIILFFAYLKYLEIKTKPTLSQEQINQIAESFRREGKTHDLKITHEIKKEKAKYKPFLKYDTFETRHFQDWARLRLKNHGGRARILNLTLVSENKETIKVVGEKYKEVEKGEIYDVQWIGQSGSNKELKKKIETLILFEDEIGNEYSQTFVYDYETEIRRLSAPEEVE